MKNGDIDIYYELLIVVFLQKTFIFVVCKHVADHRRILLNVSLKIAMFEKFDPNSNYVRIIQTFKRILNLQFFRNLNKIRALHELLLLINPIELEIEQFKFKKNVPLSSSRLRSFSFRFLFQD